MIQIRKLCKRYKEHVIFSNFNMEIQDGEFIALTGQSGCGKTTLLNMIGAIEPVTSGEILVDGKDIQKRQNQRSYFRDKIAFLFQNFALVENKTVAQNLKLVKRAAQSGITIQEALEMVELSDKLNQKVYQLSGGEQQRIALARVIIKKCDIVLADEPTGSLDKKNAIIVLELLRKINKLKKTVIIVTHDMDIANQCDRVIVLNSHTIQCH